MVIGDLGVGTFNQSGGNVSVFGPITLANGTSAIGIYNLSGGVLLALSITINNVLTPIAGFNVFGAGGAVANFGTVTLSSGVIQYSAGKLSATNYVQTGGAFTVSTTNGLTLAPGTGSVGSYAMSGGSLTVSGDLTLGLYGSATFTQNSGSSVLLGSGNGTAGLVLGWGPGGSGTYTLSGGFLGGTNARDYVGLFGNGVFNHSGGTFNPGQLFIGQNRLLEIEGGPPGAPTAFGIYNMSAGATLNVNSFLFLGEFNGANGTFNETGGSARAGGVILGSFDNTASGTVNVSGGTLNAFNVQMISSGSTFNQSGGTVGLSNLTLQGGTFNVNAGNLSIFFVNQTGGTYNAPSLNIGSVSPAFLGVPNDVPVTGLLQLNGGSATLGSISGSGSTVVGLTTPGPVVPLSIANSFSQNSITIHNTGLLTVPAASNRVTSTAGTLTIDGAGTLDLGNNELLTSTAPLTVKGYLANAYDAAGNTDWSKPGLTSSFAKGNPVTFSVGCAFGNDQSAKDADVRLHNGAPLPTNQTVVRPVVTGDADLSGKVDFFDLAQILGYRFNAGGSNAPYTDGDVNYDGVVDFFDIVTVLSANYNTGQKFGPVGATPTLTGASSHVASTTGLAVASATTIGVAGDGKPDFEYDPATGHLRFRTDGGTFTTTGGSASFVSSLTITSSGGILPSGGASDIFKNGTGATLTSTLLSSALTNTPGFTDGFDIGIVLAPGLGAATLTGDLTVKYQSLNGGQLKTADVTFIPEPAGMAMLGIGVAGLMGRRRRRCKPWLTSARRASLPP